MPNQRIGGVEYELTASTTKLKKSFDEANAAARKSGSQVESSWGKGAAGGISKANTQAKGLAGTLSRMGGMKGSILQGLGLGVGVGGALLVAKGVQAVTDAIGGSIDAARDFQAELATVNTVAKLSERDLGDLGDSIQSLSERSAKDTSDLTSAMYDLVSAGVDAKDAMAVLEDATTLATGALSTTGEAVDLMTTSINAWKLEASDSSRVMNVWAQTVANGKVTAAELASSIAHIAPIASAAGVSIEEVAAAYATMTAQGTPAAQAATQMKAAITALIKPNTQLLELQKTLNGQTFEQILANEGLVAALEAASDAAGGDTAKLTAALGSTEAYNGLLQVTGANAESFAGNLQSVAKATEGVGSAAEMAAKRTGTLEFRQEQLAAKQKTLSQDVGDVLLPFMNGLTDFSIAAVDALRTVAGLVGDIGDAIAGAFDTGPGDRIEALADTLDGPARRAWLNFVQVQKLVGDANSDLVGQLDLYNVAAVNQQGLMQHLIKISEDSQTPIELVTAAAAQQVAMFQELGFVQGDTAHRVQVFRDAIGNLYSEFGLAVPVFGAADGAIEDMSKAVDEDIRSWHQWLLTTTEGNAVIEDSIRAEADLAGASRQAGKAIEGQGDEADDATDKTDKLARALKKLKENLDEYADVPRMAKINDEIEKQRKLMNKAAKEGDEAAWARHRYLLQQAQDEKGVAQERHRGFKAWQAQQAEAKAEAAKERRRNKQRKADLELITSELGMNRDEAKDLRVKLVAAFGRKWSTKVNIEGLDTAIAKTDDLVANLNLIGGSVFAGLSGLFGGSYKTGATGATYYPGDYGYVGEAGMERIRNVGGVVTVEPVYDAAATRRMMTTTPTPAAAPTSGTMTYTHRLELAPGTGRELADAGVSPEQVRDQLTQMIRSASRESGARYRWT